MVYLYYFMCCLACLCVLLTILLLLSLKYLWAQKIYCFLFDHESYQTYKSILNYNRIFNKAIPVYEEWTTYNKELMEGRYYIMDGDLYYDCKCLSMKRYNLLMKDLIRRNSIKNN